MFFPAVCSLYWIIISFNGLVKQFCCHSIIATLVGKTSPSLVNLAVSKPLIRLHCIVLYLFCFQFNTWTIQRLNGMCRYQHDVACCFLCLLNVKSICIKFCCYCWLSFWFNASAVGRLQLKMPVAVGAHPASSGHITYAKIMQEQPSVCRCTWWQSSGQQQQQAKGVLDTLVQHYYLIQLAVSQCLFV